MFIVSLPTSYLSPLCRIAGPPNKVGKKEWELTRGNIVEWVNFVKRNKEEYDLYCWSPSLAY
jgi:hypothetical protein